MESYRHDFHSKAWFLSWKLLKRWFLNVKILNPKNHDFCYMIRILNMILIIRLKIILWKNIIIIQLINKHMNMISKLLGEKKIF